MFLGNIVIRSCTWSLLRMMALLWCAIPFKAVLNRKFHTISHCEELVTIPHSTWKIGTNTLYIFHTNISQFVKKVHEVKFHIPYMRITHIDKVSNISVAFCIRFQFVTVLSLLSVTIKYQFCTSVIIWYQFFTHVSFDTNFSHVMNWYQIFTDVGMWYRFFTFVNLTNSSHVLKL